MSKGPAADLARLRDRYGATWRVDREEQQTQETASGPGWQPPALFVAVHRTTSVRLRDESAAGLESKIRHEGG